MTSHPPARCCTVGVKHEGEPQGIYKTLNETDTYIATPSTPHPKIALLYLTDVIGNHWPNPCLIADQFAANGYPTYIPDILHNDPMPLTPPAGYSYADWLKNHTVDITEPVVKKAIEWLKGEGGYKKIGVVGYCYGAKYAIRALGDGGADVGFVGHPAFVDKEEVEAIKGPLSIAAAEIEQVFPAEKRYETEKLLVATKLPYQITLYGGVKHGFAVKADLSDKRQKFANEQAFYQAVQWFDEWLKE